MPGRKGSLFGNFVKIFAKQLCYVKGVGLLNHKFFKAGTTSPPACILSRQWGLTLSRHLLDRYLRNQILKIHRYHNTHSNDRDGDRVPCFSQTLCPGWWAHRSLKQ